MIRMALLTLLLLPLSAFSQQLAGKDKAFVKKYLEKQKARQDSLDIVISESDSTIVYEIKPGKVKGATFSYHFNKAGICSSEKVKASCNDCMKQFLQNALDQKRYDFKKINENQYVSAYKYKLLIEVAPGADDFSFIILQANWTKIAYKLLLE